MERCCLLRVDLNVPVELHTSKAPTKGGDKVYALAPSSPSDKVAVATFVMHQRQHLCAIAPQGSSLMPLTLRFADEVLPATESKATGEISTAGVSQNNSFTALKESMKKSGGHQDSKPTHHKTRKPA
jgi:hypothetical protein